MSFDLLAPHYRWMELLLAGRKLQRCRTAFLTEIKQPKHALLVGEGNGRFLQEFVHRFPQSRVTCIDASAGMLQRARHVACVDNCEFVHADIYEWQPTPNSFDLIVTNFFLDCFPADQLPGIVQRIARSATPEAHWLLADFCEPKSGWKRWRARCILSSMYLFFRHATSLPAQRLTPPDEYLRGAGFTLVQHKHFEWGLLHSQWWTRAS